MRLFLNQPFLENKQITLSEYEYCNRIKNVMRKRVGENISLINGNDGEWNAVITEINKKSIVLSVSNLLKPQPERKFLGLAFAVTKRYGAAFIIEKGVELGVTDFFPIITEFSVINSINIQKLETVANEAMEQSGNLNKPIIHGIEDIKDRIKKMEDKLLMVFHNKNSPKYISILDIKNIHGEKIVFIGPEGGFSGKEIEIFEKANNSYFIKMGELIMRSETAAIAAISSCFFF